MNKLDINSYGLSELSVEEVQMINGGSLVAAIVAAVILIAGIIIAACSDDVDFCDESDVHNTFDDPLPQYM